MRHPIDDIDDPRLAPYRALRDGPELAARGLLIAEGRRAVRALLALDSLYVAASVLVTPKAESLLALPDDLPRYVVSRALLYDMVRFRLHQGALAVGHRGAPRDWRDLPDGRLLVLDAVSDPDNVGTTFRNAAAFGASGAILGPGCADPLYRKAIRTSSGAALRLPFAVVDDLPATLDALPLPAYALVPDGEQLLSETAIPARCAVVLGNEGDGVSAPVRQRATRVRIAMADGADSVNVAAAGAIALHHAFTRPAADPPA